jgi:hypothetical protein
MGPQRSEGGKRRTGIEGPAQQELLNLISRPYQRHREEEKEKAGSPNPLMAEYAQIRLHPAPLSCSEEL